MQRALLALRTGEFTPRVANRLARGLVLFPGESTSQLVRTVAEDMVYAVAELLEGKSHCEACRLAKDLSLVNDRELGRQLVKTADALIPLLK